MSKLLSGEVNLTIDIIFGLILGEIITRLKLADTLFQKFMPFLERNNIPPVTGLALAASMGSSKTGAAIISSALAQNHITERVAIWSVLMLPLPSYLRRWPATFALSISMAGVAGCIFALSLIFRSVARFLIAFTFLRREGFNTNVIHNEIGHVKYSGKIVKKLLKTLPLAWGFYALTYSLVPVINKFFATMFINTKIFSVIPLAGWAVAAGSIAHVSAALALAGGALAAGELNTSQAVFALILGSGLGTATRILRQNAGYYFGLFPPRIARKMLFMNFVTIMPLIILSLIFAGLALLF